MIRPTYSPSHIKAHHGVVWIGRVALYRPDALRILGIWREERTAADHAIADRTGTLADKERAHALYIALRSAIFEADRQLMEAEWAA